MVGSGMIAYTTGDDGSYLSVSYLSMRAREGGERAPPRSNEL